MALKKIRRTPGNRGGAVNPPRSRAFFLELLVNMLIFTLCAVVALLVFLEAKVVTDEAATLTQLSLDAETLAEEYKVYGTHPTELLLHDDDLNAETLGEVSTEGVLTYYYDRNHDLCSAEEAIHSLVVEPLDSNNEQISAIEITAYTEDDVLFSYQVVYHEPLGGR